MIELISIHIPKTGGKSFYELLKEQYKEKLDTRFLRKQFFDDKKKDDSCLIDNLQEHATVMHGHLWYYHVQEIHEKHHSKIITWLRDPVDRVISNYYFQMGMIRENKNHPLREKYNLNIIDYALDGITNKIYKYLRGIELEELYFVGFQEHYNESLQMLSKKLNWSNDLTNIHINKRSNWTKYEDIKTQPEEITQEIKDELKIINYKDIEIYEKAIKLKNQGYWD